MRTYQRKTMFVRLRFGIYAQRKQTRKVAEEKMERLEKYLVEYCAPTLASLKTASLFSCPERMCSALKDSLGGWNTCLKKKGIKLCLLREKGNALVYVYRTGRLKYDLSAPDAFRILKQYGYETTEEEGAIGRLRARFEEGGEFPHEIGLFLGYPPQDVTGFIRYGGRCCKCTGCWKVYENEDRARRIFASFERCTKAYMRLWQEGESIMRLAMEVPEEKEVGRYEEANDIGKDIWKRKCIAGEKSASK